MGCVDCRKNRDGIIAKIDDDMLRHYCNEDVFLMQVLFGNPWQSLTCSSPGDGDGESVWYGGHDGVRHHTLRNPVSHGGELPLGGLDLVVVQHRTIQQPPACALEGDQVQLRGSRPWAGLRWGS